MWWPGAIGMGSARGMEALAVRACDEHDSVGNNGCLIFEEDERS